MINLERRDLALVPGLGLAPNMSAERWGHTGAAYAVIAAIGCVLWWLCAYHAAALPLLAPWEFSPTCYAAVALSLFWYGRGLSRTATAERPSGWRQTLYVAGVAVLYAVLQTRFDYLAQHMFFLNRVQHIVMHHLGPALIAIAWPGATLKRGMPDILRRCLEARWIGRLIHWIQQPLLASLLFVGLIALWLYPPVHFRTMLDRRLYAVMNWSMVVDGVLFWCLILDPRPAPPARISVACRAAVAASVIYPQIAIGMLITFSKGDLYAFYAWCGRVYPSISPGMDQALGGAIVWLAGTMMSMLAFYFVLYLHGAGRTSRAPAVVEASLLSDPKFPANKETVQ